MSPKNPRLGSISRPLRPSSPSDQAPGSDGDRGHDPAATPSPASIESNAQAAPYRRFPLHAFPPEKEDCWIDHIDALGFKIEQLKALANAMHCVAYCEGDFFVMQKKAEDPIALEEILPLSLLSQRLCDEVAAHVDALSRYGRTSPEEKEGNHE